MSSSRVPPRHGRDVENVDDYITNLFQPIFINDSLTRLTSASTLAQKIKGGGRGVHDQAPSQPGFTPITNMTSPPPVMPGMMSPPPMLMPLFTPTGKNYKEKLLVSQGVGVYVGVFFSNQTCEKFPRAIIIPYNKEIIICKVAVWLLFVSSFVS